MITSPYKAFCCENKGSGVGGLRSHSSGMTAQEENSAYDLAVLAPL
jgi:hypothetical protein